MGIPVNKVPLIQVGDRLMNMWDHVLYSFHAPDSDLVCRNW